MDIWTLIQFRELSKPDYYLQSTKHSPRRILIMRILDGYVAMEQIIADPTRKFIRLLRDLVFNQSTYAELLKDRKMCTRIYTRTLTLTSQDMNT